MEKRLDPEDKWVIIWGGWAAAFAIAETAAIRSENPHASLSHHMRLVLGCRRDSLHHKMGQIAFAFGVSWLSIHLWREVADTLI